MEEEAGGRSCEVGIVDVAEGASFRTVLDCDEFEVFILRCMWLAVRKGRGGVRCLACRMQPRVPTY